MLIALTGVFYFTFGEFSSNVSFKTHSIYLFTVVKSCKLFRYGFNKVLQPFVDDMKKTGIIMMFVGTFLIHNSSL